MTESAKIVGVSVLTEAGVDEWDIGDTVKVNNPSHEDHGLLGEIIAFQVIADPDWRESNTDDQGMLIPMVALAKRMSGPTLFGIPFERLAQPTPLEQLAYAKEATTSLQPSAPSAKMDSDDDSISI